MSALVDTGTSLSVISDALRHRLGLPLISAQTPCLAAASGASTQPIGYSDLTFHVATSTLSHCFLVLEHCACAVILGWDFLLAHGALIDCAMASLSLGRLLVSPIPSEHFLTVADMVQLPAAASICVPVTTGKSESFDISVHPLPPSPSHDMFLIPSAVATLSDGSCAILVSNPTAVPFVLPRHRRLAKFQPFNPLLLVPLLEVLSPTPPSPTTVSDTLLCGLIDPVLPFAQQTEVLSVLQKFPDLFRPPNVRPMFRPVTRLIPEPMPRSPESRIVFRPWNVRLSPGKSNPCSARCCPTLHQSLESARGSGP